MMEIVELFEITKIEIGFNLVGVFDRVAIICVLGSHDETSRFLKRTEGFALTEGVDFEENRDYENTVYMKRQT